MQVFAQLRAQVGDDVRVPASDVDLGERVGLEVVEFGVP